jgi:hypothetical protein
MAETKFTFGVIPPIPPAPPLPAVAYNLFFDNSQYAPAPYGTNVPFNDEPNDIWLSYDPRTDVSPLGFFNVWNFNRTVVILSIPVGPPVVDPTPIQFFDETQSTPVQQTANNDFNRENNIWMGTQSVEGRQWLHIFNYNRTGIIGSIPFSPAPVDPKTLQYCDNTNNVPTTPGVNSAFNNEPADLWIGYDRTINQICITNYDRTVLIGCAGVPN